MSLQPATSLAFAKCIGWAAQAVAALAYGVEGVLSVDKIVGPGIYSLPWRKNCLRRGRHRLDRGSKRSGRDCRRIDRVYLTAADLLAQANMRPVRHFSDGGATLQHAAELSKQTSYSPDPN